jgi:guanylate kinase
MPKRAKRKRGLLVVISGPSGVGKSTVVRRLFKICPELLMSISSTTRPPRPGEAHGQHYFFITEEEFDHKVKKNEFLEWAKVHGCYYGTPKKYIDEKLVEGEVVVLEVDVQGAASVKRLTEEAKLKAAAVFVFLIPPSVDILAFRLKKRKTEDEELVNYRLRAAIAELQVMEKYDYIVVNDKVESAADKIKAIINVEKERTLLN